MVFSLKAHKHLNFYRYLLSLETALDTNYKTIKNNVIENDGT